MGFRKANPYECYKNLDFKIPVGKNGCYDRYLCRVEEMRESVKIIKQCLKQIPVGPSKQLMEKYLLQKKKKLTINRL